MAVPKLGSIPRSDVVSRTLGRLGRLFTNDDGNRDEEPSEWRRVEHTRDRTKWRNGETGQLVVCKRQYEDEWTAKAKPALVDGEPVDLNLTAGPTSREIAEFLARQYMAHELVLAPVTAMRPRWH